ncbi:MAG: cytochrome c oxidase subunit II [Gammaproteobacteria bacterium]|nr:cytochrome c oxidase subunit II [Gammaproteobacteria bacterium]
MKILRSLFAVALLIGPALAKANYGLNMTRGVTANSHTMYDLHMMVLWICVVVGVAVFGVIIYSIIYHRKSKGVTPASFHESTTVEVIWTIIPFAILVAIAVPTTTSLLAYEDVSNSDIDIKATGWQWKWEYEYISDKVGDGAGVRFMSQLDKDSDAARKPHSGVDVTKIDHYLLNVDNPLVVPVGKKVRILTTGKDVIHSWWVPALGVKRDAIPGYINESQFTVEKADWDKVQKDGEAIFRGQCAELCGREHGFMPIVVKVVSEDKYKDWVKTQKGAALAAAADSNKVWTKDELIQHGAEVYAKNCAACHQPSGEGLPPMFPALKGSKIVKGPIENHIHIVVKGKPGTAMAPFGTMLSDADIAAAITYERNSWGNNDGDMAQPSQIKAAH